MMNFRFRREVFQDGVVTGDAQQPKTDNQHAGNGAATKRHGERGSQTLTGGFCGTHIGAHGNIHADIAGCAGE